MFILATLSSNTINNFFFLCHTNIYSHHYHVYQKFQLYYLEYSCLLLGKSRKFIEMLKGSGSRPPPSSLQRWGFDGKKNVLIYVRIGGDSSDDRGSNGNDSIEGAKTPKINEITVPILGRLVDEMRKLGMDSSTMDVPTPSGDTIINTTERLGKNGAEGSFQVYALIPFRVDNDSLTGAGDVRTSRLSPIGTGLEMEVRMGKELSPMGQQPHGFGIHLCIVPVQDCCDLWPDPLSNYGEFDSYDSIKDNDISNNNSKNTTVSPSIATDEFLKMGDEILGVDDEGISLIESLVAVSERFAKTLELDDDIVAQQRQGQKKNHSFSRIFFKDDRAYLDWFNKEFNAIECAHDVKKSLEKMMIKI